MRQVWKQKYMVFCESHWGRKIKSDRFMDEFDFPFVSNSTKIRPQIGLKFVIFSLIQNTLEIHALSRFWKMCQIIVDVIHFLFQFGLYRIFAGSQGILLAYLNCFVHAVMYTYYLITIYKPMGITPSVAMKKNITRLQMVIALALF